MADNVASASASSEASLSDDSASAEIDPKEAAAEQAAEAKYLKADSDIARRTGDTLTISYDGKPTASFTAATLLWQYRGSISMIDDTGHKDRLAVIYLNMDEQGYSEIVRRDGTLIGLDQEILPSPDGHTLASGYGEVFYSGNLNVVEWVSAAHPRVLQFAANCYPVKWQDASHFTAGCVRDEDDSLTTTANISRDGKGVWHLDETATLIDPPDGPSATVSPLRHQIAILRKSGADANADYMIKIGYRRLTTP
ncbi:MAG: hypothetical protein JF571_13720 [Asticcacaulis sp.]|nr:hypothetical protein [Asticcacaulis sp.]